MSAPDRTPVIVGVGQVEDRPAADRAPLCALDLMQAALEAAEADAGAPVLRRAQWVGVVDALSWEGRPEPIHPHLLARLNLDPRHAESSPSPSGNYPLRLLNEAADAIAAGEADWAAVVGGEAMRTMAARAKGSGTDVIRSYRGAGEPDLLQRYGVLTPMDVYPFYEQATRHAWGQTQAEATAESAVIWAGSAAVAAANPHAWVRRGWSAERIATPAADNPLVAWPYTRAMVANSGVNMGAGVILASAAAARDAGLDPTRFVTIGHGAAADEAAHNLQRAGFDRSPAMQASIKGALEANGIGVDDLDLVELYSCFPCVPKMARRVLGWPAERPSSVYGGLSFGGGPIGNCMTHAVAAMTGRLREGAATGLVFANGGFATKNHTLVLRRGVHPRGVPKGYDRQAEADRLRGPVPPLLEDYAGPARLETFAASCADGRPVHANVLALTPDGARVLCRVPGEDGATLAWLTGGADPVGVAGVVAPGADGLSHWVRAG